MSPCLSFSNVCLRFGKRELFKNLTFELHATDILAIIGPSGEGKTLLLKTAAGLVHPSSGTVTRPKTVSMAFQRNGLFDSMTPMENVLFPLKEIKSANAVEIALGLLTSVGLETHANKKVSELSGGQQKRLSIARALAVAPELVLYDDPTAGLDPVTSFEISELIQTKQREMHHAVLMVTSDIRVAFRLATKLGFLYHGDVMEWGSVDQFKNSSNPYVHQFVGGLETGPLSAV